MSPIFLAFRRPVADVLCVCNCLCVIDANLFMKETLIRRVTDNSEIIGAFSAGGEGK